MLQDQEERMQDKIEFVQVMIRPLVFSSLLMEVDQLNSPLNLITNDLQRKNKERQMMKYKHLSIDTTSIFVFILHIHIQMQERRCV